MNIAPVIALTYLAAYVFSSISMNEFIKQDYLSSISVRRVPSWYFYLAIFLLTWILAPLFLLSWPLFFILWVSYGFKYDTTWQQLLERKKRRDQKK